MAIGVDSAAGLYKRQQDFFKSGATLPYAYRKAQLKKLRAAVKRYEAAILRALASDLAKPDFEAYGSEVGFFYAEIGHTIKYLREWMDPRSVRTSIAHFPTRTRICAVPKGQVLILGPWNYPFMLIFDPLQAVLAAGNTAVLKLPRQTPATSAVMRELISETFDESYVACVDMPDDDIIPTLVEGLRFDHIFFTGSTRVGKLIARAAATQLIPLTLELGGKSPAIVDKTAKLKLAAQRIVWGKSFNAGQTCVAPDYVIVHEDVATQFLPLLEQAVQSTMQGYGGLSGFPKIVNQPRFDTLLKLAQESNLSPEYDPDTLRIGLTLASDVGLEEPLMQEEIFGPLLPVLTYQSDAELQAIVQANPDPLSLYLFSADKQAQKRIMTELRFGGGCINNCLIHFANPRAPIGGVGDSGMGSYHGKAGFDTFSQKRTVMRTGTWIDIPLRYAPYTSWKSKLLRVLFR